MAEQIISTIDPELQMLINNKESGYTYRERRQEDWRENYTLYRDKVQINRLTQRQSVNVPLMKRTIRTLLKDVDDMPVLQFENLDNDKQAEIFQNEYWRWTVEANKMEIKDMQDKKQEFFFGRTFDQMQIVDGMVKFTIVDPEDMLVDRFMDPSDIDSARFLIHTHIFVPLAKLEMNPDYDKEAIKELKIWHGTKQGILKAATNQQMLTEKNQKMSDLGVEDMDDPVLGETYVELSMHFVYGKRKDSKEEELFLKVEADDMRILLNKPLEDIIGKTQDNFWRTHFPYNTWADDIDKQDFWTDGIADIVRTSNKILNAWYSQLIENRTLKNLNMNIFDSNIEGFTPQTWTPRAFGMYGVPVPQNGKISDVFQQLPVADLSDSIDEMTYIEGQVDKATGSTSTQQGATEQRQITLGEVQLALGEAKERIRGISKFYTQVWKDRAQKFLKLIEAAPEKLDAVRIYKKGRNTNNMYSREISPQDWMTKSGYTTRIWSQEEKNEQDTRALEKMSAIKANMPDNPVVDRANKRKLLEFGDFTPEETNDAMAYEESKMTMQMGLPGQMGGMPQMQPNTQVTPIQ